MQFSFKKSGWIHDEGWWIWIIFHPTCLFSGNKENWKAFRGFDSRSMMIHGQTRDWCTTSVSLLERHLWVRINPPQLQNDSNRDQQKVERSFESKLKFRNTHLKKDRFLTSPRSQHRNLIVQTISDTTRDGQDKQAFLWQFREWTRKVHFWKLECPEFQPCGYIQLLQLRDLLQHSLSWLRLAARCFCHRHLHQWCHAQHYHCDLSLQYWCQGHRQWQRLVGPLRLWQHCLCQQPWSWRCGLLRALSFFEIGWSWDEKAGFSMDAHDL